MRAEQFNPDRPTNGASSPKKRLPRNLLDEIKEANRKKELLKKSSSSSQPIIIGVPPLSERSSQSAPDDNENGPREVTSQTRQAADIENNISIEGNPGSWIERNVKLVLSLSVIGLTAGSMIATTSAITLFTSLAIMSVTMAAILGPIAAIVAVVALVFLILSGKKLKKMIDRAKEVEDSFNPNDDISIGDIDSLPKLSESEVNKILKSGEQDWMDDLTFEEALEYDREARKFVRTSGRQIALAKEFLEQDTQDSERIDHLQALVENNIDLLHQDAMQFSSNIASSGNGRNTPSIFTEIEHEQYKPSENIIANERKRHAIRELWDERDLKISLAREICRKIPKGLNEIKEVNRGLELDMAKLEELHIKLGEMREGYFTSLFEEHEGERDTIRTRLNNT